MNIGMMWFDNDPKTDLEDKVSKAAEYYRGKYGRRPNLCLVHPDALEKHSKILDERKLVHIDIRPLHSILPGHLWIGVDDHLPTGAD